VIPVSIDQFIGLIDAPVGPVGHGRDTFRNLAEYLQAACAADSALEAVIFSDKWRAACLLLNSKVRLRKSQETKSGASPPPWLKSSHLFQHPVEVARNVPILA
jgi:hypothetical protein